MGWLDDRTAFIKKCVCVVFFITVRMLIVESLENTEKITEATKNDRESQHPEV